VLVEKQCALFLDRDGVINENKHYVHKQSDFEFIDGIFEICQLAQNHGYLIVIVTNQSGIGRGYFSIEEYDQLTEYMKSSFAKNEIRIHLVLTSSIDPTKSDITPHEKFRRKPFPGMFFEAESKLNLNLQNSIMIGDSISDIQAAENAGIANKFLIGRHSNVEVDCFQAESLLDCISLLRNLMQTNKRQELTHE
jgi:D-glycero-D-manno-heptose 1,7-bisphosphate phosphatase